LSEGDVQLLKLFGQTVPQSWPDGGKKAVTELVELSLEQACLTVSRPQRTAVSSGNQRTKRVAAPSQNDPSVRRLTAR